MLLQRSAVVVPNPKLHLVLRLPTRPLYPSYCAIQVHFELCEFRVVRFTQSESSCGCATDHLCRRREQTSISSSCVSLRETCFNAKAPMLNPDFGRYGTCTKHCSLNCGSSTSALRIAHFPITCTYVFLHLSIHSH